MPEESPYIVQGALEEETAGGAYDCRVRDAVLLALVLYLLFVVVWEPYREKQRALGLPAANQPA